MKNQSQVQNQDSDIIRIGRARFDSQTRLDTAIFRTSAMLEGLAALLEYSDKSEQPQLSDSATDGLKLIARELGERLGECFDDYSRLVGELGQGSAS